jgi:S1-C subfamily serine protease
MGYPGSGCKSIVVRAIVPLIRVKVAMIAGVLTALVLALAEPGLPGPANADAPNVERRPVAASEPTEALAALEAEQSVLFARVAPSVVLVVRDGTSGSGFVVRPDGLVLTNAHVVGDADDVALQTLDGRFGRGRVLARATGSVDLALVQSPFRDLPSLEASDPGSIRAGMYAATVGHGGGAAWTFSTGLVSNPRPLGDGARIVLAQMALRPGSSGGPLVDRQGRAIGIVTSGTRDASGVTFAIRADAAADSFPELGAWLVRPVATSPAAAPTVASQARAPVDGAPGPEVARLASTPDARAPGETLRVEVERASPRMITVWEAPRAVRRGREVASRPRPLLPSHAAVTAPPPPQADPWSRPPPNLLLAGALAALGLVGWFVSWSRAGR